jgi:hypothetical protein
LFSLWCVRSSSLFSVYSIDASGNTPSSSGFPIMTPSQRIRPRDLPVTIPPTALQPINKGLLANPGRRLAIRTTNRRRRIRPRDLPVTTTPPTAPQPINKGLLAKPGRRLAIRGTTRSPTPAGLGLLRNWRQIGVAMMADRTGIEISSIQFVREQ